MNVKNNKGITQSSGSFKDLAQRSASSAVLAAIALFLTIVSYWTFAALVAVGAIVLAWEWENITTNQHGGAGFRVHSLTAIIACILAAIGEVPYAALIVLVGGVLAAAVSRHEAKRIWSAAGIFYLGIATVILTALRIDENYGLQSVLLIFIVVWSADIAAYFAGRTIGGPKLAPRISPGKTWSGFVGGLAGPALMVWIYAGFLDAGSTYKLIGVGVFLALASQIGDLLESAIKRKFDVKDSGKLLPGHGGLFDRVDGLVGASLAAGILVLCRSGSISPRALVMWN